MLIGIKYDYQDDLQTISLLSGIRLLPSDCPLKVDLFIGGGIASIEGGPFNNTFFTGGIMPKYFIPESSSFFYISGFGKDIQTGNNEYDFINGEVGLGFYF